MKSWKKYIEFLTEGDWHIHTNYTDGKNTVFEYCEKAVEIEVPLLAFTEHVRKDLNYDFNKFLNDIEFAKKEFDLIILSGCEAKVLPNGELDIKKDILKKVDYPIFSFHSFPNDIELYVETLKNVLKNKYVNTWAHPGELLLMRNLKFLQDDLKKIFELMHKHEVLFEINRKYNIPTEEWINLARDHNVKIVNGSDAHCIEDLQRGRFF